MGLSSFFLCKFSIFGDTPVVWAIGWSKFGVDYSRLGLNTQYQAGAGCRSADPETRAPPSGVSDGDSYRARFLAIPTPQQSLPDGPGGLAFVEAHEETQNWLR